MATLQSHHHLLHCYSFHSPKLHSFRNLSFVKNTSSIHKKIGDLSTSDHGFHSFCCFCTRSSEIDMVSEDEEIERPPFDINLAVILAGFAFEAYISPPVMLSFLSNLFENMHSCPKIRVVLTYIFFLFL